MKVNNIQKINLENIQSQKDVDNEDSIYFKELIANRKGELSTEKLEAAIKEIQEQGATLVKSRTIEDLKRYKKIVKEFVDDAVKNSLKMDERRGFNRRGKTRVFKIVSEVDKKLVDLTDAVIQKEKKSLDILGLVGEIEGMLVDIYA